MNWLAPKLSLRVAQKQILTPGLVQMVSVLALNRLELREMINQEIMANPVLEEVTEESAAATDSYHGRSLPQEGNRESSREAEAANPFDEFDFGSFFDQYLDTGARTLRPAANAKKSRRLPSTSFFLPRKTWPIILTWQLSVSICTEKCARSPKRSSATWMRTAI